MAVWEENHTRGNVEEKSKSPKQSNAGLRPRKAAHGTTRKEAHS